MFRALICSSSGGDVYTTDIYNPSWWWANKCLKHVEAINHNKLKANDASCWSCYTDILQCMVNKTLSVCNIFLQRRVENYAVLG
jgi:hypothetical protein